MKSDARACLVFVTAPDLDCARRIARAALEARLVACANVVPGIESHYWWQGKVETGSEVLVLFKTQQSRLRRLERLVLEGHPYDTPEFLVVEVRSGSARYLDWIGASLRPALALALAILAGQAGEVTPVYFRADQGIADPAVRGLPATLEEPAAQRWRTPLLPGHSSPIAVRDRLVLTTFDATRSELATVALDADSGRVLWERPAPARQIEPYHAQSGSPAAATPASDGDRLYVFFGSCGLLAYDLDGRPLWERSFGPFQDEFGAGSSPILAEGRIILNQDHDLDSFLAALDPRTGAPLWRTPRPAAVRSYSTPVMWRREGRSELLVAGALELASYDPATGEKRWSAGGLARIVIPTPVTDATTVYMASWTPGGDASRRIVLDGWPVAVSRWDRDGDGQLSRTEVQEPEVLERFFRMDLDQNQRLDRAEWERHAAVFSRAQNSVLAIRPAGPGVQGTNAVRWQVQRGAPYVSSPLLVQGRLWVVKDGGIVTVFEAATGRILHEERLPGLGSYQASPVTGEGRIYFASEPGTVSVVAERSDWQVLGSRHFGEQIHATPLLDRRGLFLRTDRAVYRLQSP